ncbi:hypothetical protein BdWA1_001749 [Babesia duncani]|uniref:Uncharacterized protein n=1 Tax=Babesia duncani TaxID=323732 RepID=A0AAD9PL73_9APIC|nr:hypothetical protein BdWA1_001749 [Babesia duncani]
MEFELPIASNGLVVELSKLLGAELRLVGSGKVQLNSPFSDELLRISTVNSTDGASQDSKNRHSSGRFSVDSINGTLGVYAIIQDCIAAAESQFLDPECSFRTLIATIAVEYEKLGGILNIEPVECHLLPACKGLELDADFTSRLGQLKHNWELQIRGTDGECLQKALLELQYDSGSLKISPSDIWFHDVLAPPVSTVHESDVLNYDNLDRVITRNLMMPHLPMPVNDAMYKYLLSDELRFPPMIDKFKYGDAPSDYSDFSGYSDYSVCESDENENLICWGDDIDSGFLHIRDELVGTDEPVIPLFCGSWLDDAMWVLNGSTACQSVM